MAAPSVVSLFTAAQLELLARHGEERTAEVGEKLFEVGDRTYPFIAIREGEAAILDPAGHEIVRHRTGGFLGEMNLLSGQTVYLTAVVTEPMRYIAVERETLRRLLFDDSGLSELVLSTLVRRREALQQLHGIGIQIVGPRSSEATRAAVDWGRRNRMPHEWVESSDAEGPLPLVRLPGGPELHAPSNGEIARAIGVG